MARFTTSVAKFITTPRRVLMRGDATSFDNPLDADLVREIPKAMRRDLRVQGFLDVALLGFVLFVFQLVQIMVNREDAAVGLGEFDLIFSAIFSGCGMLVFGSNAYCLAFWRQQRYRRKYGKWLWEQ